jgi:LCP family protein required for cell wall assembly
VPDPTDPRTEGVGRHAAAGKPAVYRWGNYWWIGRTLAAALAVLTLLGVGLEWQIKHRADVGLAQHQVSALVAQSPMRQPTADAAAGSPTATAPTVPATVSASTTYTAENILLVGSDSRAGINGVIGGIDSTTNNVANSDVVMLAHISADRQHVTVLSIPRDTMVPAPTCRWWDNTTGTYTNRTFVPTPGERFHFNSGYSVGGPRCVVTEVQDLTGLRVDRFIGIDFVGFQAMVDALGGVTVNICSPIVDSVLGTVAPNGGTQRIGGAEALALVRARHVVGDTESDLARIRRQQVVLSAILRQVDQAGTLLNPARMDAFLQAFTKNTFTDNVTLDALVTLAGSLGDLSPGRVNFYTLPNHDSTTTPGALEVSQPAAGIMFTALLRDQPVPVAATSAAATPASHPTTVVGPATAGVATPGTSQSRPTTPTRLGTPALSQVETVNAANGLCAGPPPARQ